MTDPHKWRIVGARAEAWLVALAVQAILTRPEGWHDLSGASWMAEG